MLFTSAGFTVQFIITTSVAALYLLTIKSPNMAVQTGYLGCPNKENGEPIQTLRRFSNEVIQGFLIHARSIGFPRQDQLRTQHHQDVLTKEELDAINILRDCPDSLMSADVNPRDRPLSDRPPNSNGNTIIDSWCTYCTSPRRLFKTKDAWARHEKETHEEHVYRCMPNGAIEITERGPACAICKTIDPDKTHLDKHDIGSCHLSTHVYKRRIDLVNHLKVQHGVVKGQGLAEDWKRTPDKEAWACGFCVSCFPRRMDRINHIYTEHYAQGTDIRSWDPVKVIQGLLRQPRVLDTWSKYLFVRHPSGPQEPTWQESVVESLQRRLEMGEESPDILVTAAYDQSNLGPGVSGSVPMSSNIDANMDATAADAIPHLSSQTIIPPPDSSCYFNGSETSHEPGSSDMDRAEFLNVDDLDDVYHDAESAKRSTQTFEPHIHQASKRSTEQVNDTVPLDDVMDDVMDDKGFPGFGYFDEALGDANAGMHYYVADVEGKSITS